MVGSEWEHGRSPFIKELSDHGWRVGSRGDGGWSQGGVIRWLHSFREGVGTCQQNPHSEVLTWSQEWYLKKNHMLGYIFMNSESFDK